MQFYDRPQDWNGEQLLIPVENEDLQPLIDKYVRDELFQFCSPELDAAANEALLTIDLPALVPGNAWDVFSQILPLVEHAMEVYPPE